jgi:hypothetical protein
MFSARAVQIYTAPLDFFSFMAFFGLTSGRILELYLQSPVLAISLPGLQYALLQTFGTFFATVIPIVLAFVLPCLRLSGSETHNPLFMVLFLASALRMWDFGLLPEAIVRELSFVEFITYLLSFQLPERIQIPLSDAKNVQKHAVPYKDQTAKYFARQLIINSFKIAIYFILIEYLKVFRAEWDPPVLALTDLTDFRWAFDMFFMGLALSLLMEASCAASTHLTCYALKIPYMPIMNQPYLATSIRDFWGNRWNMIVQRGLRRIVFDPVMNMLGVHYPLKPGFQIPFWKLMIAGFATFAFSGLMHEWTMVAIMERRTTWEQFWFFTIHGVISILETIVRKVVLKSTGIDLAKSIPYPIQVLYAQMVMITTGPLFLNPYIREKIYFKYTFF